MHPLSILNKILAFLVRSPYNYNNGLCFTYIWETISGKWSTSMNEAALPIIGAWYRNESGAKFEVVAFDQDEDTIEIQYFDGTIEEVDLESWNALGIHSTEPPEDWTGSYDVPPEDYGVDIDNSGYYEKRNPLEDFEK